jgi:flagellin-like hook-associated protein FlgL
MIGALGSSVTVARRAADAAGNRLAQISRQMATGQEVGSVKDDGARWAQAAALRSQKAEIAGRGHLVDFVRLAVSAEEVEHEIGREQMAGLRDTLMRALDSAPGSQTRATLHAEFQQKIQSVLGIRADSGPIATGYDFQADGQWGILSSTADTVFNGKRFFASLDTGINGQNNHAAYVHFDYVTWSNYSSGGGPKFNEINLTTATNGMIQQALNWIDNWYLGGTLPTYSSEISSQLQWLDSVEKRDAQTLDRLDLAVSSLTDADLGALSSEKQNAQAQQQLALQTVQQAISAYGNFASGLLGNVQRTQRGVLA